MKTIKFFTLGCKVNQYDTQVIREQFLNAGFKELDNHRAADIYVINTCTVTQTADRKSRHFIHYARRENPQAKIVVTGCYTELDSEKIVKITGVTHIIKNKDKEHIINLFYTNSHELKTRIPTNYLCKFDKNSCGFVSTINKGISYFQGHTRAFLKIQDGCDNFCSYCKVPLVRGKSRSRDLAQIIKEARALVESGFKEIVLTGICLGSYGKDLLSTNSHESKAEFSRILGENNSCEFDKNSCLFVPKRPFQNSPSLVDVIEALEKIGGLLRIRLSSIEAGDVSDGLIQKIAQSKKPCRHLHIPIQSGDNEILKRMNRKFSQEDYLNLIQKIKKIVPEVAITTDILVGFPGESDENFQNTIKLIKEVQPLRTHIFPYSPRQGTQAAINFKEKLNYKIIKERLKYLKNIAEECAFSFKREFLNKNMDVLVETQAKEDENYWQGYTDNYIKVQVESRQNLKNQLINVEIKKIDRVVLADLR